VGKKGRDGGARHPFIADRVEGGGSRASECGARGDCARLLQMVEGPPGRGVEWRSQAAR
jgi:hypothetical protein